MADEVPPISLAKIKAEAFEQDVDYAATCLECRETIHVLLQTDQSQNYAQKLQQGPRWLGNISALRQRQKCILCRLVLGLLPLKETEDFASLPESAEHQRPAFHLTLDNFDSAVFVHDENESYYGCITSQGIGHDRIPKNPFNPQLYSSWVKSCESGHPEDRNKVFHLHSLEDNVLSTVEQTNEELASLDLILLDVLDECLIKATSRHRYIALSYVWGGSPGLELLVSNRRELETPGSLTLKRRDIPPAIQGAMRLVKLMGERYLWVDRLSIEQDNQIQKMFNISRMDAVYSRALVTLADLSSVDATQAIPGIVDDSRTPIACIWLGSKPLDAKSGYTEKVSLQTYPPTLKDVLPKSIYETRAWTLQERLLSRRCLYFTDHMAYFYCQHGVFHCDADGLVREHNQVEGNQNSRLRGMVDPLWLDASMTARFSEWQLKLAAYTTLVHQYTARTLGFSRDKLNAFSGILAAFLKTIPGGATGGLPEFLLDYCLLWNHVYVTDRSVERDPDFPSWTWAGWNHPKSYYNGPLYLEDFSTRRFASVDRKPKRRLVSHLERVTTSYETPIRSIVRIMDDSSTWKAETSPDSPKHGRDVLHFEAKVVNFSHFGIGDFERKTGNAKLTTTEGYACGILYICSVSIRQENQNTSSADMDLALLSTVECPLCNIPRRVSGARRLLKPFTDDRYCRTSKCTLLHVMVIQWHDNGQWAERKGIATIQCGAWERCQRRTMRITLK